MVNENESSIERSVTAAARSATPIDVAAGYLVAEPAAPASVAVPQNIINPISVKPEDQIQTVPHGGIEQPSGGMPADVDNDEIFKPRVDDITPARKPDAPTRLSSDGTLLEKKHSTDDNEDDESTGSDTAELSKEKKEKKEYQYQSKLKDLSASDAGLAQGKKRDHWYQVWRPKNGPRKPPKSLDDAPEIPLAKASFISQLTYSWVTPLMVLGYQRPLQATDLWKMDPSREAGPLSDKFLSAFNARRLKAEAYNARLDDPINPIRPSRWKRANWHLKAALFTKLPADVAKFGKKSAGLGGDDSDEKATGREGRYEAYEYAWRRHTGRKRGSVVWSLNDVLTGFWVAGLYKVVGDTAQMMTPLVTKQLILHAEKVYAAHQNGTPQPSIGPGVAMAFGVLLLTILTSLANHQFFFKSMSVGVMARATLISATYKQVMALTVGERAKHPSGKIMAHLSADITRIDFCAQWFHAVWTAPIQLGVCLVLLLTNLGPSALVGMSLFLIVTPLQTFFMKLSYKVRQKSMKWTDARSRILQELLSSMQIIKQFTYERPFLRRIYDIRDNELVGIRTLMYIRAANQALAFSVPVLASIVAFACYSGVGNRLEAAEVFTSLSLFMLLRQPLMFLPRALSSLSDAQSALGRITPLFEAETASVKVEIDYDLDNAIEVENASFEWVPGTAVDAGKKKGKGKPTKEEKEKEVQRKLSLDSKPFHLDNINLTIPRGKLVAIVGPIGSGKSSLLQGLLGDMRQLSGSIAFGGTIGYAQQQAWIQNLTLRENITSFGQKDFDEKAYWEAVKEAALPADLELLGDGDGTEIGERGVNLSGGQKQRVNIARVLYRDPDIAFFDDVLSALDAHVGQWVFDNAIMGLKRKGKTVVMVTHAVHLLDKVDYIYTMENGTIAEQGTFNELMGNKGAFCRLIDEFGGMDAKEEEEADVKEETALAEPETTKRPPIKQQITEKMMKASAGTGKLEGRLMVPEVRKSGRVGSKVYGKYFEAARALGTGPFVLGCAILMQGAQISSTLWLTWWQKDSFHESQGYYMGIYAAIGLAQSFFTFAVGVSTGVLCFFASSNLFKMALERLFHAPMSTFDTVPTGRLMSVLTKDIDTVDSQLADSWRMSIMTVANCIGSVIIITVFLHYFIAVVFAVGVGYAYFAMFYRASAREVKRLDAMTRSLLYSHFSETLSGLATIRAFSEERRFKRDNAFYMDLEDRAYLLTCANQRWLSVRLDCTGGLLSFAVAMMAAKGGSGLTGALVGLTLTYMTTLVQQFGMVTRQSAELENNMNAVERVLQNANLPQEKPYEIEDQKPKPSWPEGGAISFRDCVLSYRPGLAPALKGISLDIRAGERLGIIGRTGAGKSSLTVALYRLVELTSGSITIDGIDISTLGLKDLRQKLAIIPQDPRLFAGTIRSCLDPFEEHDDAYLYEALRRTSLLDLKVQNNANEEGNDNPENAKSKFTLDSPLDEEGANLSVGERSLVSLARALVKDAKITILDEATASIDLQTDMILQETINRDFVGRTLIAVAHRIRTIIGWDRISVMDAGLIAELGTPLELFDNEGGIFRSLCERSQISRADIERAQEESRQQRLSPVGGKTG